MGKVKDNNRFMATMEQIEDLGRRLGEQFRPDKVILFGSYARGEERSHSDVALLVIMPFEGRGVYQAAKILASLRVGFPVDVIVRSPEEIQARLEVCDHFIKAILEEGRILYDT